jgi:hypothetical protein
VRGKPSNKKPTISGLASSAELIIPITTSSGTNCPLSINFFASSPSTVLRAISLLSKSPVERCLKWYLAINCSDCVPFPLPGGPNKIILNISSYSLVRVKYKGWNLKFLVECYFLEQSLETEDFLKNYKIIFCSFSTGKKSL